MHIVLLNQFYPPDVAPTGRYLHDVALELRRRGHQVTAIASRHGYGGSVRRPASECVAGITVRRLRGTAFGRESIAGKVADYGTYYGGLATRLAREERPDVVLALTTPPFLGLLAKLTAALRGAQHMHWVMDVYPDVLGADGLISGVSRAALDALTQRSLEGASRIVTLGRSMAQRVSGHCPPGTPIDWVPLWAPRSLSPFEGEVPLRAARGWNDGRLTLAYSGNMGRGHRFEEFLEAARRLGPDGPRWVFAGGGQAREGIEAFAAAHASLPIELLPYAPEEHLREHLAAADVHLVSLDSRWEGLILPSKLQGAFAVGRPVICVGDAHGDLATWVRESGGGWVVPEGDVEGLLEAIGQAGDADTRARRGEVAARYAASVFDAEHNIARMADLITSGCR